MTGRPEHCRRVARALGFTDPALIDSVAAQLATDRAQTFAAAALYVESGDVSAALGVYSDGNGGHVRDPLTAAVRMAQVVALDALVLAVSAAAADDDPDELAARAVSAVAALRAETAAWKATTLALAAGPAQGN